MLAANAKGLDKGLLLTEQSWDKLLIKVLTATIQNRL